MSVKIIIDSSADLPESLLDSVSVVPMSIRVDEEEFIDGVTITRKEFYEMLIESDVLPQTSQATPDSFEQVFREAVNDGDTAVVITVSSKLSGTYQSAMIAAEEFPGKIYVVDSQSAAIGAGILTQRAIALQQEWLSAPQFAGILCEERNNICIIAMLDTLEYLKRSGRISPTVAFAGSLLAIKPVVSLEKGEIKRLGKARGSKHGNNLLVKMIEENGGVDFDK
ncbi:MAG: DegV family protein, partial [Clostridia bacterium]|nr:DegV family protein [Clostridia bacterium]